MLIAHKSTEMGLEATRLAVLAKRAIEAHGELSDEARGLLGDLYSHVRKVMDHFADKAYRPSRGCCREDLRQFAAMRLPVYVQRFDPSRCQFGTMVSGHVYRECQREMRRAGYLIAIPHATVSVMNGWVKSPNAESIIRSANAAMRVHSGEVLAQAGYTSVGDADKSDIDIDRHLAGLDPHTRELIARRYGVGCEAEQVKDIARSHGVNRWVVRDKIAKGVDQLRESIRLEATA